MLGEAQLFVRAQHTAGLDAAELALGDVDAAGQIRVVLRDRDEIALVHVLCAGDDLHRLARAAVDHANPHMIGIFVLLHRKDLADDDVLDLGVHALGRLDLLTGEGHDRVIFFIRSRDVNEFAEPFS